MGIFRALGHKLQGARGLGSKILGGVSGLATKVGGVLDKVGEKVSIIAPSIGGSISQAGHLADAVGKVTGDIKSGTGMASLKNIRGVAADAKAIMQ